MSKAGRGGLSLLLLLLCASVAIKLATFRATPVADDKQLVADLRRSLAAAGYRATVGSGGWWNGNLVTAYKPGCTVMLRDATQYGADYEAVSQQRMSAGSPIRYFHDGKFVNRYPTLRIEIAWRLQREMARVGWRFPIAPVIAVGARDGCWPEPRILSGLTYRTI